MDKRVASASFLARVRARLIDALALYLAQPVRRTQSVAAQGAHPLYAMLRHGDVLLSNGNTRAAAIVRRLTGSTWAHVAIYVGPLEHGPDPRCVVEADVAAGVRAIRLSELQGQETRILRPVALPESDRRRLTEWVVARIGDQYDIAGALALAKRLMRLPVSRLAPAAKVADGARRFICSSLLAQAFLLVGYQIFPAGGTGDARVEHRDLTPRDFESASGFEVVSAKQPG